MLNVYTDGACKNNGKKEAKAGIGIYFGPNDDRNLSCRIDGKQSNNTAELCAIIYLYFILENDIQQGVPITVYTDSKYVILCVTSYGKRCYSQGWENISIPNKHFVKQAYEMFMHYPNVIFRYVKAHTKGTDEHSIGNRHADRLACESLI